MDTNKHEHGSAYLYIASLHFLNIIIQCLSMVGMIDFQNDIADHLFSAQVHHIYYNIWSSRRQSLRVNSAARVNSARLDSMDILPFSRVGTMDFKSTLPTIFYSKPIRACKKMPQPSLTVSDRSFFTSLIFLIT
jgi:hypothetical protein